MDLLLPRTKKKMAVCFGYLGSKYQGLQVNPDADTIEKELERALFLCGGIHESNFGFLQKVQWTRAARTGEKYNYSCLLANRSGVVMVVVVW